MYNKSIWVQGFQQRTGFHLNVNEIAVDLISLKSIKISKQKDLEEKLSKAEKEKQCDMTSAAKLMWNEGILQD